MNEKTHKSLAIIFIGLGIISLIFCFEIIYRSGYFIFGEKLDLDNAYKFGGFIAGVTGIFFTGATALLIYLTFQQQREQFRISQFEITLFNLISQLQVIVENISGLVKKEENIENAKGREYFYYGIRELNKKINDRIVDENHPNKENQKFNRISFQLLVTDSNIIVNEAFDFNLYREFIKEIYNEFYHSRYSSLGHYFRFVFNLINYVDKSLLSKSEKWKYVNLIQAQMTHDELGLLLYNGLGQYGEKKLFSLLENYDFLSNVDKRVLQHPNYIIKLYPKTRFKFLEFEKQFRENK